MKIRCETTGWTPGTYPPTETRQLVCEGEIAGTYFDPDLGEPAFIVWDEAIQDFHRVPVANCKRVSA